MISVVGEPGDGRCLEFWYHMYGQNIGQLNVYINTNTTNNDTRTLLWSRGANIGDVWRKAHISTEYTVPFRVIFEGLIGNGHEVSSKCQVPFFLRNNIFRVISRLTTSNVCRLRVKNQTTVTLKMIFFVDGKM